MLLGATEYDTAIDMWSIGCIFGELVNKEPLLPGRGEIDQITKVSSKIIEMGRKKRGVKRERRSCIKTLFCLLFLRFSNYSALLPKRFGRDFRDYQLLKLLIFLVIRELKSEGEE